MSKKRDYLKEFRETTTPKYQKRYIPDDLTDAQKKKTAKIEPKIGGSFIRTSGYLESTDPSDQVRSVWIRGVTHQFVRIENQVRPVGSDQFCN